MTITAAMIEAGAIAPGDATGNKSGKGKPWHRWRSSSAGRALSSGRCNGCAAVSAASSAGGLASRDQATLYDLKIRSKMEDSMTYNLIAQNNDDTFYTAVCAYVRGEPNGIVRGTVGEEQAEIAKRLLQENPAILDDKDRLLAEIATIHYRESGMEAAEARLAEVDKKYEDDLFTDLVAYVRGLPHEIPPHTNRETWAKQAEQLAAEDPTILDDQKRLLAATLYWSPLREADLTEQPQADLSKPPKGWLVHNGRVNRDCISDAEYNRRMEERRAAGLLIEPSTAEVACWHANYFDPYGDGLALSGEAYCYGRQFFVSAPGSDSCVFIDDLPEGTQDEVRRRIADGYYARRLTNGWWGNTFESINLEL
jgi:hypothetical protein